MQGKRSYLTASYRLLWPLGCWYSFHQRWYSLWRQADWKAPEWRFGPPSRAGNCRDPNKQFRRKRRTVRRFSDRHRSRVKSFQAVHLSTCIASQRMTLRVLALCGFTQNAHIYMKQASCSYGCREIS